MFSWVKKILDVVSRRRAAKERFVDAEGGPEDFGGQLTGVVEG